MVIHELFLDRPVEPFAVGVHLRRLRVGMVVREMQLQESLREVLLELTAVVRENEFERDGKDNLAEREELLRRFRGMGRGAPCEGETTVEIFEGDDVAPAAVDEAFNGVEGGAMSRVGGFEVLGFSEHLLPVGSHDPSRMGQDLLREDAKPSHVLDEPSDCGDGWDGQELPPAEHGQEDLHLRFAEVGMLHAKPLDLFQHFQRPCAEPTVHRDSRPLLKSRRFPMAFPQLLLPEKERPAAHTKRIHRCRKPVLLPEHEDLKLLLRFVRHMLPPYCPVVAGYEPSKAFECRLETSFSHRSVVTQGVQYVSEPMQELRMKEYLILHS